MLQMNVHKNPGVHTEGKEGEPGISQKIFGFLPQSFQYQHDFCILENFVIKKILWLS